MTQSNFPPPPPPGQGPINPGGVFAPVPPPRGGSYMPPPMFAPPPRCRGGSFARLIFSTIAVLIFLGSLGLNFLLLFFIGMNNNPGFLHSTNIIDGDPNTKIAVVPINGLITASTADKFDRMMRELQKDSDIKALVIQVDSPGGTVTASDEIYHRIQQYKDATHNKVVIDMTSLAASGGYYLSAAGDYIMAEPTTMTGSIGVLMPQIDLTGLGDKYGIHDSSIHSTGADFKEVGSPLKPETPEQQQYLLDLIDQAFARFKSIVVAGRQHATNPLHGDIDKIANGKVYTSKEAKDLGLIDDDAAYPEDAYNQAAKMAGVSKPTVVKYELQQSIWEMLTSKSPVNPLQNSSAVNVNVNSDLIQELISPQLMYLTTK